MGFGAFDLSDGLGKDGANLLAAEEVSVLCDASHFRHEKVQVTVFSLAKVDKSADFRSLCRLLLQFRNESDLGLKVRSEVAAEIFGENVAVVVDVKIDLLG